MALNSEEKLQEKFLEILADKTPYSPDELLAAVKSFYNKLRIADKFQPQGKIKATAVLVKAADNFVALEDDYGLNKVSRRPTKSRRVLSD